MEEVLERQERERRARIRRRAASKRAQREPYEQLGVAVALLEEENQSSRGSREGQAPNVDRDRHSRVETLYTRDYLRRPMPRDMQCLLQKAESRGFPGMIGSIDCMHWQWKNCPTAWQGDYGNRKGQKSIILEAVAGFDTWNGYYLVDGIYPRWTTFVKSILHPRSHKEIFFAAYQEGYRKDVERCFGILQARWAIIRGAARLFDEEMLMSVMMTCIILHNMIVEDEYDYDANEVYESDPMNTALTQIYEKPMGPNGEQVQHDPLVRDGSLMHRMIERYTEMQSSYIHEHR
ncbi:PREDICTED: uncharacterized protein LOC103328048 [Prunus mume]|uniref:Uncharacterized protein LOC103328048 n=1 Tax=Prunus mume TaxID=102107 RepID=A0ABM0NRB5_PRUMU|nr:PREDICTED: uncharacterized protein LOC103328048 [Prunus mume]